LRTRFIKVIIGLDYTPIVERMANVKIFGETKEIRIDGNKNGEVILKHLGLSSSSTIILRDGKPVPEDTLIGEDDDITVIKSFSGG
jgi:sulfur carrier protein ThiS